MNLLLLFCLELSSLAGMLQQTSSQKILVITTNVLEVGEQHKVVVAAYGFNGQASPVSVSVQLLSGEVLYQSPIASVPDGGTIETSIRVHENRISVFNPPPKYLFVRAETAHSSLSFSHRRRVVLSLTSLSVFIQTDKPIYVREDEVHVRIVVVNSRLIPNSNAQVVIDLINPAHVVVDRFELEATTARIIRRHTLKLGPRPSLGKWTIVAKYGIHASVTAKFHFQVDDYILPRFDVKIVPPDHITPTDEYITFGVTAKYTYGKGVVGSVSTKLGVWDDLTDKVTVFLDEHFRISPHENGEKRLSVANRGYGIFPLGQKLWIYVAVTEGATGKKFNVTDLTTTFTASPYTLQCEVTKPYYKPGLPVTGSIKINYVSGNPVQDLRLHVRDVAGNSFTLSTDKDGTAVFSFPTTATEADFTVSVRVDGEQIISQCTYKPFEKPCSEDSTHIYIRSAVPGKLKVGLASFEILQQQSKTQQIPVTVLVTAHGHIHWRTSFAATANPTLFTVDIQRTWSNKFNLIAFYYDSRCDTIISDAVTVIVEDVFVNEISVLPLSNPVLPGDPVSLEIKAKPDSDVALLAVDAGLYALNNQNKLTREQVFDKLGEYDLYCEEPVQTSTTLFDMFALTAVTNLQFSTTDRKGKECTATSTVSKRKRDTSRDDLSCCAEFRLIIGGEVLNQTNLADEDLDSLADKCNRALQIVSSTAADRISQFNIADCALTEECIKEYQAYCVPPELRYRTSRSQGARTIPGDVIVQRRSYFPHVWLVDDVITIGSTGIVRKDVVVPHSITDWVLHGLSLSEDGFGVAKTVRLRAFKSVFLECNLPFSVRRQEQVSIACTAYNYRAAVDALVQLVETPPSLCTTAGLGTEGKPVRIHLTAKGTETVLIPMIPLDVGKIKLTVQLATLGWAQLADRVTHTLNVEYEGVNREYYFSAELDPGGLNVDSGCRGRIRRSVPDLTLGACYHVLAEDGSCQNRIPNLFTKDECCDLRKNKMNVGWGDYCEPCPRSSERRQRDQSLTGPSSTQENYFRIRIPPNSIPGSEKVSVSVTGKYLQGNIPVQYNVRSLLRTPGGCGEQNMVKFGPNIAVLKYLKHSGRLTRAEADAHINLVKKSYQIQLTHRTSEGGFAISSGSTTATWLTAFVLRTICSAMDVIYVESSIIVGSQNFLMTRQRESGEFFEGGSVSGYIRGKHRQTPAGRTAYVVIGMLECCHQPKYNMSTVVVNGVCRAVEFLEKEVAAGNVADDHTKALVYYAFTLACTNCSTCNCSTEFSNLLLEQLETSSIRRYGMRYWIGESGQIEPPNAESVEITSYMLCSYIAQNSLDCARPIGKWVNSARNGRGAFRTTQDTCLALKCLSDFASHLTQDLSMTVTVSDLDESFTRRVRVDNNNRDVTSIIGVPITQGTIKVITTGTGLGLVQIQISCNVPDMETEGCQFDFTVSARFWGKRKNNLLISACAKYKGRYDTGMSIMEIEIPTGFVACEFGNETNSQYCLSEILSEQGDSLGMFLYEVNARYVTLYLNKISSYKTTCVEFIANQKFAVAHVAPVEAKVYDYYDRDIECSLFYSAAGESATLALLGCDESTGGQSDDPICICGAGLCPKLEAIDKRLCNACSYHHYAFKVKVTKVVKKNTWIRYRCTVEQILKPGRHGIKVNDTILFWMQEVCKMTARLKERESYHIMGLEGEKFILDHNAHIEQWPKKIQTHDPACLRVKQKACIRKRCRNIKGQRKRRCEQRVKPNCAGKVKSDCTSGFSRYVNQLTDNPHVCERNDLCI